MLSEWPWLSCTSTSETSTREQSIAPSSGSTTVTENGMLCPHSKTSPSTGVSMVTFGAVLPTVIGIVFESDRPPASVTVSFAV